VLERVEDESSASAEVYFNTGEELLRSERYAEALSAFQAAHALLATPRARLMAARCLRKMQRLPEAYDEYQAASREADTTPAGDAETESTAQKELAALAPELAFVVVETETGVTTSEFRLGQRSFSSEALGRSIAVSPGKLSLSARIDGQERQLMVNARSGATSHALLTAPPTPRSKARARGRGGDLRKAASPVRTAPFPYRTAAFIAGGTGVASALVFGVLAPISASQSQGLEGAGRRLETVSQIGLAAAVLGVGTGITLYLAAPSKREQGSVAAVLGPRSLKLEGCF